MLLNEQIKLKYIKYNRNCLLNETVFIEYDDGDMKPEKIYLEGLSNFVVNRAKLFIIFLI